MRYIFHFPKAEISWVLMGVFVQILGQAYGPFDGWVFKKIFAIIINKFKNNKQNVLWIVHTHGVLGFIKKKFKNIDF